ncbi:MAG TPA: hypothetical protein VGV38_19800, partial [Pyrinomonadaceae bacterium]|nr:hypothetical protein [Pyrinomonadaceae bacterium]
FYFGQARFQMEDFEGAAAAFDEALKLSRPGEPFVDPAGGTDLAPRPDASKWPGVCLGARGFAEMRAGHFAEAEASLRRALDEGDKPTHALELLAHVYRNWGLMLLNIGEETEGRRRFAQHLEVLERLYAIAPAIDEVEAALSVAEYFEDEAVKEHWLPRRAAHAGESPRYLPEGPSFLTSS